MVDQDRRLGRFATFVAGAALLSGCAAPRPSPAPTLTAEPTSGVDLIVDCEKGPFRGERLLNAGIGEQVVFEAQSAANGGMVELQLTPEDGSGYKYQVNRNSPETYSIEVTGLHSFNILLSNLDLIVRGNQAGERVTGKVSAVCLDRPHVS